MDNNTIHVQLFLSKWARAASVLHFSAVVIHIVNKYLIRPALPTKYPQFSHHGDHEGQSKAVHPCLCQMGMVASSSCYILIKCITPICCKCARFQ